MDSLLGWLIFWMLIAGCSVDINGTTYSINVDFGTSGVFDDY